MKSDWSDKDILEHLLSGNRVKVDVALRHVYKAYFNVIKNYILKNQGTIDDAADIFQDTIIAWYDMVQDGTFKRESSILTFLYSVARNIWLKELRKSPKKELTIISLNELGETLGDLPMNNAMGEVRVLRRVMDELGENCKEILASFYFRKLSMKDIMTTFSLGSEQAAKTKKYRCMQQLIKLFQTKGIKKEDIID